MAQGDDGADRTETATEKRRQDFREKGDVAKSRDIISVLVLFCAAAYFLILGPWLVDHLEKVLRAFFDIQSATRLVQTDAVGTLGRIALTRIALMVSPLVVALVLVSILGNVAQVGVLITTKPLVPDLNRINFFTKFISTFFSKQAFGMLVTNLLKIAIAAIVIWLTLSTEGSKLANLPSLPLISGILYIIERAIAVLVNVTVVLIAIAIADYAWNKYLMEEKMKMTKQEVKDEAKEHEGNPHVKSQQRRRAHDMANARLQDAVPQADVVINNPTHLSIALRYRQGVDEAPLVLAKGADHKAMKIREIARAHNVPMVTNVPVARMLYKHIKVGKPVPNQFFRAVAEVLAYVYRLRGKLPSQERAEREAKDARIAEARARRGGYES